jgi:hypothetical protein
LGTVDGTNVLHLNDLIKVGPSYIRVNPQFQGRLEYIDTDTPEFEVASIGNITDKKIILIEEGTQASPQTFEFRNFRYYVRGNVDILATARDGDERKGLYRVGSNARPITVPNLNFDFPPERTLEFGYLLDMGVPVSSVKTIYYYRWAHADTYMVSNEFFGPTAPQVADRTWGTSGAREGAYNLCVILQNHPPQPGFSTLTECTGVWIDNAAAAITMSNSGGTVTDGGATSTATITIAGTDAGGIKTIKLEGPSYSSTSYVSGVQTSAQATFPTGGSLADGSYTATVTDLAGNAAEANFNIDTTPPSCAIASASGVPLSSPVPSTATVVITCSDPESGVTTIDATSAESATAIRGSFPGDEADSMIGPIPSATGTYHVSATNGAGLIRTTEYLVVNGGSLYATLCLTGTSSTCSRGAIGDGSMANRGFTFEIQQQNECNQSNIAELCKETGVACSKVYGCDCKCNSGSCKATTICQVDPLGDTFNVVNSTTHAGGGFYATLIEANPPVTIQILWSTGTPAGGSVGATIKFDENGQKSTTLGRIKVINDLLA